MRYWEVILEYSQKKVTQVWADKLQSALQKEIQTGNDFAQSVADEVSDINQLVNWFEQQDPTQDNKYTEWLIRQYSKGGIEHLEDIPARLTQALKYHNRLARSGRIDNKYKNIDAFKNISQLEDFIESYYKNTGEQEGIDDKGAELIRTGEAEIIYNGPDYRIVIPKSHQASCTFGSGTRWCTTQAETDRHWENYSRKGTFYYITDKNQNTKIAINFGAKEYRDAKDAEISRKALINKHPNLMQKVIEHEGGPKSVVKQDAEWIRYLDIPDMTKKEKERFLLINSPETLIRKKQPDPEIVKQAIQRALERSGSWDVVKILNHINNIPAESQNAVADKIMDKDVSSTYAFGLWQALLKQDPNIWTDKVVYEVPKVRPHYAIRILGKLISTRWPIEPEWPDLKLWTSLPQDTQENILDMIDNFFSVRTQTSTETKIQRVQEIKDALTD